MTIIRESLNRRTIEVVTPKCFLNRFYILNRTDKVEKCLGCAFITDDGQNCEYEEYRTDTTRGMQDAEDRFKGCEDDLYFIHFNCVTCGELISQYSERMTIPEKNEVLECKHCGTPHALRHTKYTSRKFDPPLTGDEMIFAVPVNREKYRRKL